MENENNKNWQTLEDEGDAHWEKFESIKVIDPNSLKAIREQRHALMENASACYYDAFGKVAKENDFLAMARLHRKIARYKRNNKNLEDGKSEVNKGLEKLAEIPKSEWTASYNIEEALLQLELTYYHLSIGGDNNIREAKSKAESIIASLKEDLDNWIILGDAYNVLGIALDRLRVETSVLEENVLGCWFKAIDNFKRVSSTSVYAQRKILDVRFNIAVNLQIQGDYNDSIKLFELILEDLSYKRQFIAKHNLALNYLDKGELTIAKRFAKEVWKATESPESIEALESPFELPDRIWARELKLRILAKDILTTEDDEKVNDLSKQARKLYRRSLEMLRRQDVEDSLKVRKRSELHRLMAEVYLAENKLDEAEKLIKESKRELNTKKIQHEVTDDERSYLKLTNARVNQIKNNLDQALEDLIELDSSFREVEEFRKVVEVEIYMAEIYIHKNDIENALSILKTAQDKAEELDREYDLKRIQQLKERIEETKNPGEKVEYTGTTSVSGGGAIAKGDETTAVGERGVSVKRDVWGNIISGDGNTIIINNGVPASKDDETL